MKLSKLSAFVVLFLSIVSFNVNASNDKVSVIILIYNTEPYIEECLDSVINQTYKNLEIICVDDCGTDNSMKIVERYQKKDPRIRIIHNKINCRQGISRNEGFKKSTGDYILFLDSDDYLNLDIIEKLVTEQKKTNADVIVSLPKVFISDKDKTDPILIKRQRKIQRCFNKIKFLTQQNKQKVTQISIDNFRNYLRCIFTTSWGKLYTKNFLVSNNIYHINKKVFFEDLGYHVKILSSFPKIYIIDDIGTYYRIRNSSISGKSYLNRKLLQESSPTVLNDAFNFIKNHHNKDIANNLIKQVKLSNHFQKFYNQELSFFDKLFIRIKKFCKDFYPIFNE